MFIYVERLSYELLTFIVHVKRKDMNKKKTSRNGVTNEKGVKVFGRFSVCTSRHIRGLYAILTFCELMNHETKKVYFLVENVYSSLYDVNRPGSLCPGEI